MPFEQRPGFGSLFANNKKSADNQPDFKGDLTLDRETLQALIKMANEGKPMRVELGGWKRLDKNQQVFLSLKGSVFVPKSQPVTQEFIPSETQREVLPVSDDEIPF